MHNTANESNTHQPNNGAESFTSRYFLHHHAPDHISRRTMSMMRRVSSIALQQMTVASFNPWKHRTGKRRHSHSGSTTTIRVLKPSSMSAGQLNGENSHCNASISSASAYSLNRGHALAPATCSRLRLPCETCQHTVHRHRYLYCKNCPVVCHTKDACLQGIPRGCPGEEVGIEGWGESRHAIRLADQTVLDMEDVYLSGMLGLQSNKCFECGRPLNSVYGYEYPTRRKSAAGSINGLDSTHSENPVPVHKKSKRGNSSPNIPQDASAIRACHLTGKYYCERCHWNDQWYIPGSIFLLNDTSRQPVCRSAYLKIRVLWDAAIFRIPFYWHQENTEASRVYDIRIKLHQMLRYMVFCEEAAALKAFAELTEPTHLLGYPNYLRMVDVIDILKGTLRPRLQRHLERWTTHINTCERCLEDGLPTEFELNITHCRRRQAVENCYYEETWN